MRLCRLTFLALALAIPSGTSCAQPPIQIWPGVVLTYITHNFDQPRDREFDVTIDSVTPDETVFVTRAQKRATSREPKRYNWGT